MKFLAVFFMILFAAYAQADSMSFQGKIDQADCVEVDPFAVGDACVVLTTLENGKKIGLVYNDYDWMYEFMSDGRVEDVEGLAYLAQSCEKIYDRAVIETLQDFAGENYFYVSCHLSGFKLLDSSESAGMSYPEQESYLADVAKKARQEMWRSGYEDVHSSTPERWNEEALQEYVLDSKDFETALYEDEIEQAQGCLRSDDCALYFFSISSNFHGGTGVEGYVVLLNMKKKKHQTLRNTIYVE